MFDFTYVSPSLAVRFLTDFAHLEPAYPKLVLENFEFLFNTEYAALFRRLLRSTPSQGSVSSLRPAETILHSSHGTPSQKARRSQIPTVYWKDIGGHEEAKTKLKESFGYSPKVTCCIGINRMRHSMQNSAFLRQEAFCSMGRLGAVKRCLLRLLLANQTDTLSL